MCVEVEKGQTFFVLKGTGFMQADQIVEVVAVEVHEVINPQAFTTTQDGLYKVEQNAFRERSAAYERALGTQGHRVVLTTDTRRKHLEQWDVLIQEFHHELPYGWYRENLASWEFGCKHNNYDYTPKFQDLENCQGGAEHMDLHFIERLQLSRKIAGIPYNINSGWRCEYWNAVVGGSSDSSHMRGLAADIEALTPQQRYTIVDALIQAGFKRLGIGKNFIHVDADTKKEQGLIWLY